MKRAILFFILLFTCPPALAAEEAGGGPARVPARPRQPVNPITQAAVQAGILPCAERVNQVSNFLTGGNKSGAFLFTSNSQAEQSIFSASLEIETGDGSSSYASMSFAPGRADGCGALYETVTYWDKSPDELAKGEFSGLKRTGVLYRNMIVLDAGENTRIFIMPAGNGCVSIKKEVLQ